ncbi:hypothetical protein T459_24222 [Capsicum annuum]|uniref:Uncharacterized protein n=1 Tax=Capsicum annuum TaxID=4072 RepID=A0A2G2YUI4_CAPAN|nr:hypothetical protein T459_24222 [Capsicum annuum]
MYFYVKSFQVIIAKANVNTVDMAHASVTSLMRTIESLLISNSPMQSLTCDHREDFSALHEKISSLEVVVKNFEKNNLSGEMTDLEVEIKEVANIVEQTIQLRVTEVVLANDEKTNERLSDTLQVVAEDMDRIWKESTKIQDKGEQVSEGSLVQGFSNSTNNILNAKNNMAGRDDQKEHLLEDLTTSYSSEPKVIPIVGMGGIGKTTLAKEVYNHESILRRFDVRAWATVSQHHNKKEILLSLLQSTIKMDDTDKTKGESELADMLQKSLKRKRYLIILDDIWSCRLWDGVRRCFPTEYNAGSRILLTTRNNKVACYAGKQIADECHGLPLTIVVVAGLLKSKRAIEDWRSVAKDVKSLVTNDPDERCSRVLGLSYNHLTSDQKTCLLHFGIFPEDSEIPVKILVRSWMAEGFLKLENDLEGEAEKCLLELVDRCLVLVCKKSLDERKIRSCKVHDLIYDLCVREIQRENIFIMNDIVFGNSDANHVPSECQSLMQMQPFKRLIGDEIDSSPCGPYRALLTPVHRQLRYHDNNNLLKRTHSIFSFGGYFSSFILNSELIHFKLLKVLELRHIEIDNFPVQMNLNVW